MIRETFRSRKFRNQPSFLEHSNVTLSEFVPALDKGEDLDEEFSEEEEEEQI